MTKLLYWKNELFNVVIAKLPPVLAKLPPVLAKLLSEKLPPPPVLPSVKQVAHINEEL